MFLFPLTSVSPISPNRPPVRQGAFYPIDKSRHLLDGKIVALAHHSAQAARETGTNQRLLQEKSINASRRVEAFGQFTARFAREPDIHPQE